MVLKQMKMMIKNEREQAWEMEVWVMQMGASDGNEDDEG